MHSLRTSYPLSNSCIATQKGDEFFTVQVWDIVWFDHGFALSSKHGHPPGIVWGRDGSNTPG